MACSGTAFTFLQLCMLLQLRLKCSRRLGRFCTNHRFTPFWKPCLTFQRNILQMKTQRRARVSPLSALKENATPLHYKDKLMLFKEIIDVYTEDLRAWRPGDHDSIPGRGEMIFLYPLCRDRLWGRGVLSPGLNRGRGMTLTTHPHLMPRYRKSRSYTSSPHNRLRGV
jgi:hypothetical protein